MNFNLNEVLEILEQTPQTLKSLLGNLSDGLTRQNAVPDSWSPFDIVGHLIHGEETDWIPRARIILDRGNNPKFEPFDRFAQFEKSAGRSLDELLEQFDGLRAENLKTLRSWNLTAEQLLLPGIHPELGKVNLCQLLAAWAVHDLNHISQIVSVLAGNYSESVGPWRKYLSILN